MFKVEQLKIRTQLIIWNVSKKQKQEQKNTMLLLKKLFLISGYEVIYIGSPIYWDGMSEKLLTVLRWLDYTGKIIRPFITHESSGLSRLPSQLKEICNGAEVLDGLTINDSQVNNLKQKVEDWI